MTAAANFKFSLKAISLICAAFTVLALAGVYLLYAASQLSPNPSVTSPSPNWDILITGTQERAELKNVCEMIAKSAKTKDSVIELQRSVLNKGLTVAAWAALSFGCLGAVVIGSLYRQLSRVSKANEL